MKRLLYKCLAVLILAGASCSDEHTGVHPGQVNHLSCRIQGVEWAAHAVEYYFQPDSLNVLALHNAGAQVFYLEFDSLRNGANSLRQTAFVWRDGRHPGPGAAEFFFDSRYANTVWIDEYDPEAQLVKGRFQFTLVNDSGVELPFHDGVFELIEPRSE